MDFKKINDHIAAPMAGRILPISKETRKFHRTEAALIVGKRIGRYRIERVIGHGGMSTVYEAKDGKSGKKKAVKIYNKNNGGEHNHALDFLKPEHILRKMSIIASIRHHPNIVSVLDMGVYEDRPFVVMELLDGISIQSYIANNSNPSWKSSMPILLQMAFALEALHNAEITHMDVKPSNFFISEKGIVKIFDFDISFVKSLQETQSSALFIGSEHYASPEQFKGARYFDPRIDIYSFGVVMYELVCGRHPFQSDDIAELMLMHMNKMPEHPGRINPNLPPAVGSIVMKALEKKPEMRFQNIPELVESILKV